VSGSLYFLCTTIFMALAVGIPVARILRRTGFSPWLAILVIMPIVNLFALWLFAFNEWPGVASPEREADNWSEGDRETFRRLQERS